MRLHRRAFLTLSTMGVVGSTLSGCRGSAELRRRVRQARPVARAFFEAADLGRVRDAGRAFLGTVEAADDDALRALFSPVLGVIEAAPDEPAALLALEGAITDDFADLDIVDMHGWMLSPTEVGLAAMLVF